MDMYHVKFQSPDKSNGKVAVNKLKSKQTLETVSQQSTATLA